MSDQLPDVKCRDCHFGEFVKTPSGRIKRDVAGTCTVKFDGPVVPASYRVHSIAKLGIWPETSVKCTFFQKR